MYGGTQRIHGRCAQYLFMKKPKTSKKEKAKMIKIDDHRGLRPFVIQAKKQKRSYVLDHNEIYKFDEKTISFRQPNNISISLNISSREYDISKEMYPSKITPKLKKLKTDKHIEFEKSECKDLFDFFEHLQVSLIFAYTAVEAFSNVAIPDKFTFDKLNNKKVKETWTKENIERWLSTTEKLGDIVPTILEVPSPKGQPFWDNFKKLEKIRDEIIHQKTITNETNVSSRFLKDFFKPSIFEIVRSGYLVIQYFCSQSKVNQIYFPLGMGTAKIEPLVVDDFEKHFATVEDK